MLLHSYNKNFKLSDCKNLPCLCIHLCYKKTLAEGHTFYLNKISAFLLNSCNTESLVVCDIPLTKKIDIG